MLTATTRTGTFASVIGDGFAVKYLADRVRLTPPELSIADKTVTEGNTGFLNAQFQVVLSSPSDATVTVAYATAPGTATSPADYTHTTGTLSFAPNDTTETINVPIRGDLLDEAPENYTVNLSAPTFAEIADGAATGTITDNDPPPALSINDVSRSEGGAAHAFSVTLSAPSGQQVRVDYATADGSATAPGDYQTRTDTLVFQPGQTTKPVRVPSVEDTLDEAEEPLPSSSPTRGGRRSPTPAAPGRSSTTTPRRRFRSTTPRALRAAPRTPSPSPSRRPAASRCASTTRPRTQAPSLPATTPRTPARSSSQPGQTTSVRWPRSRTPQTSPTRPSTSSSPTRSRRRSPTRPESGRSSTTTEAVRMAVADYLKPGSKP